MKLFVASCLAIVTLSSVAAPFQNLGFDEANTNNLAETPGTGSFRGPADEMLPGWRLFNVLGEAEDILFNSGVIGLNQVVLYDRNFLGFGTPVPLEGKYALGLWPGYGLMNERAPYHLSQIGEVPSDAKSIHFVNFGSSFDLLVNGQEVPLIYDYPPDYPAPIFNRHIPVPAVGDISAFAGQTVELEFLTSATPVRPGDPLYGIDTIFFSPELIPEPSTWALLGLGGISLLFRRRFLRSSARVQRE